MPAENGTLAAAVKANLSAAAATALFLYVIVAVLQQSDAELVLPGSSFDLGGLLKDVKEGIPGGSFIAPILQVKIPLTLFYTLGPVALLAVHAALVLDRRALAAAVAPLRFAAIWAPPVTLALIRWRFAPYVLARPEPSSIELTMETLQTVALALDAAVVATALLRRPLDLWGATDRAARLRAVLARGCRHGATVALILLLLPNLPRLLAGQAAIGAAVIVRFALVAALLLPWLAEGGLFRGVQQGLRAHRYRLQVAMEDLTMVGRVGLLAAFIGLAALPGLARGLDLDGASLVAKAPAEQLVDTLLADAKTHPDWGVGSDRRKLWQDNTVFRVADARLVAWRSDGRGISLAGWKFPDGHFDRATMALIRMGGADIHRASLDSANLVLADLTGADMADASLRSAALDGAQLNRAVVHQASFRGASLIGATMLNLRAGVLQVADTLDPAAVYAECKKAKDAKRDLRTDFSDANMTGADLRAADLSCANLTGVTMTSDTKLQKATLIGADFSGANLNGAIFTGANLQYVTMNRDTQLSGTDLQGVDFSHASLRGTDFSQAKNVITANFDGADVSCAVFPRVFDNSKLSNAIVTGTRLLPLPPGQDKTVSPAKLTGAMLTGARQVWPQTEQEWEALGVACLPHAEPAKNSQPAAKP